MNRILLFLFVATLVIAFTGCSARVFEISQERANNRTANIAKSFPSGATERNIRRLARQLIKDLTDGGGCNRTVCFAVEGSGSVSDETFGRQSRLTAMLSSIMSADNEATFGAVQYSMTTYSIMETTPKWWDFVSSVYESKKDGGPEINLSAALAYCGFQLRQQKPKEGAVIVIGSGRYTTGFDPAFVSSAVLEEGKIIPISTGRSTRDFRESLQFNRRDIISFASPNDFEEVIEAVIPKICK